MATDDDYFERVKRLLVVSLETAVPLWVERLINVPFDYLLGRSSELSNVIASQGDILQFRSEKRGETAKVFNAFAEAVAICSFVPGGIKIFGIKFEYNHPESLRVKQAADFLFEPLIGAFKHDR